MCVCVWEVGGDGGGRHILPGLETQEQKHYKERTEAINDCGVIDAKLTQTELSSRLLAAFSYTTEAQNNHEQSKCS